MNNTTVKLIIIIYIFMVSCGVSKSNNKSLRNDFQNPLKINLASKTIVGKVIGIDSTNTVYEIMVLNNRRHKILSKKTNVKYKKGEKIMIGSEYKFKVVQLTHKSLENNTQHNSINNISIMPTYYLQDCIKFNNIEFCSDSWEVYEGLNIINLYIIQ